LFKEKISFNAGRARSKTTELIWLDSLLQEVEATLPRLVFQIEKAGPRLKKHGGKGSETGRRS
jgi:hypothetical protein